MDPPLFQVDLGHTIFDAEFDSHVAGHFVLLSTDARQQSATRSAAQVVGFWPHADLFADRANHDAMPQPTPGAVEPYGDVHFSQKWSPEGGIVERGVLWAVTQLYPGPSKYDNDSRLKRIGFVERVLRNLQQYDVTALTVPLNFACECHPEDWPLIHVRLLQFAVATSIRVRIVASLESHRDLSPYGNLQAREWMERSEGEWLHACRWSTQRVPRPKVALTGGGGSSSKRWGSAAPSGPALRQSRRNWGNSQALPSAADELAAVNALGRAVVSITEVALSKISENDPDDDPEDDPKPALKPWEKPAKWLAKAPDAPLPPEKRWTTESWYEQRIVNKLTLERILEGRALTQDEPKIKKQWLEFKEEYEFLSSSTAYAASRLYGGSDEKTARELARDKVWHKEFNGNKFTEWGNLHEDDAKWAYEVAERNGLLWNLPHDGESHVTFSNADLEWLDKHGTLRVTDAKTGQSTLQPRRFTRDDRLVEYMGARGVNVDVEDLVLAYSYDGLYRMGPMRDAEAGEVIPPPLTQEQREIAAKADPSPELEASTGGLITGERLIECKCLQTMPTCIKPQHFCQKVAMMGGLQKQGHVLPCSVYVVWQRAQTRFFILPEDKDVYEKLRREMVWMWHNILLPLYVARDNGLLRRGEIQVATPLDMDDLSEPDEAAIEAAMLARKARRGRRRKVPPAPGAVS